MDMPENVLSRWKRIATKASETNEGFNLVVRYVNELSSKVDQIMEVASPSDGSQKKKARGKKSSSTHQDGSTQIYDTIGLDNTSHFNQDSTFSENTIYNSNISAAQSIADATLSQQLELSSLSMAYPSFTQMLTEPSSFHSFQHLQNSCSLPHDQLPIMSPKGLASDRDMLQNGTIDYNSKIKLEDPMHEVGWSKNLTNS
ncbi:hypothetical protein HAX54_026782 [Datura stramonium]|uniref:Uncharacterized protein n=1 Tax=Datura stramonium TaxID=4076 RepID=A0ABS8V348_DATST|nr:hypothetical protein [Datura stramonium]